MATFEEQLADRTPWTLADIARELSMQPRIVAEHAYRALHDEADTAQSLPAPLPGTYPGESRVSLVGCALGHLPDRGPKWAAGDIRSWAMRCARLNHELKPIKLRPPNTPHPRTRETNPTRTRRAPRKD